MLGFALLAFAAIAAALVLGSCTFVVINDGYVAFVERLGVYNRTLNPGLHALLPFAERLRRVNWRHVEETEFGSRAISFADFRIPTMECIYDPPETESVTLDRVKVFVNVSIHYAIADPKKAVYEIRDLYAAMANLIDTSVRSSVARLSLDDAIGGAATIEEAVRAETKIVESDWGLEIRRVRIQEVRATEAIMIATEEMVRSERTSRARFVTQQAESEAAVSKAEADRRVESIAWETALGRTRAETTRATEESEARATARARSLEIESAAEAAAAEIRARAEAGRVRALIEAGADVEYLGRLTHAKAFSDYAANARRGDMLVPYEFARVFGDPATLRRNV